MTKSTEKTNPRVVLYARVGTEAQARDDHHTLNAQLSELRAYAASRGWTNSGEFAEMISGLRRDRPQLEAVLTLAQAQAFDILLVHDLARLSRSVPHIIEILDLLENQQVGLASLKEPDFSAWRRTTALII